ncbi:MAG: FHA domain-containing protein [Chloroflexi bacterium]|nr:FHA domain-containing protein [Chloroflexota bacterium]
MKKQRQEATMKVPSNIYLIIANQIFPIVNQTTHIGRLLVNDIVVQDLKISRQHACIRFENGKFVIYDSNSTGGTFVNNQQISKCQIISGDLISLADVEMMFLHNSSKVSDKAIQPTNALNGNMYSSDHDKSKTIRAPRARHA